MVFASLTAKPSSTWIAQESANVSRGWERLFKAFCTGLHWILAVEGDLVQCSILPCFELLCLPCDSHECLNSLTFRMAYTSTFEGKYTYNL